VDYFIVLLFSFAGTIPLVLVRTSVAKKAS
jgi:hypothetical protein